MRDRRDKASRTKRNGHGIKKMFLIYKTKDVS
jgi:hypothetical protein